MPSSASRAAQTSASVISSDIPPASTTSSSTTPSHSSSPTIDKGTAVLIGLGAAAVVVVPAFGVGTRCWRKRARRHRQAQQRAEHHGLEADRVAEGAAGQRMAEEGGSEEDEAEESDSTESSSEAC